jgi:hypothetical protein
MGITRLKHSPVARARLATSLASASRRSLRTGHGRMAGTARTPLAPLRGTDTKEVRTGDVQVRSGRREA